MIGVEVALSSQRRVPPGLSALRRLRSFQSFFRLLPSHFYVTIFFVIFSATCPTGIPSTTLRQAPSAAAGVVAHQFCPPELASRDPFSSSPLGDHPAELTMCRGPQLYTSDEAVPRPHGDLLPLPVSQRSVTPVLGTARSSRRKVGLERHIDEASRAVNALGRARAGRPLDPETRPPPTGPPTLAQTNVRRDFGRRIRALGAPPDKSIQTEALRDLLKSRSRYDTEQNTAVAPYDEKLVNVMKAAVEAQPLVPLVGPDARPFLEDPHRYIY